MIAIIGGTGFGQFASLANIVAEVIETPFGAAYIEKGTLQNVPLFFLPRHGNPPKLLPHRINYRANIAALHQLGVEQIISVNAVGSVDPELKVGDLVFPDQLIDYTYDRAFTFFDDEIHHIDFSYPYSESLRQSLITAAGDKAVISSGVYGCTQGPRLETAAEIKRLERDGCTIVGMTAMPEAGLAREKSIDYAGISVVVNAGAGMNNQAIDIEGIKLVLDEGMSQVAEILQNFVGLDI